MEKDKAREKYDDALASGNTAVLLQEKEDDKEMLQLNVG